MMFCLIACDQEKVGTTDKGNNMGGNNSTHGGGKSDGELVYSYYFDEDEYEMIYVEGSGDICSFYIMQTEMLVDKQCYFGNANVGRLDMNNDGYVIKAEFKDFIEKLREGTGLDFRLPTAEEWIYAAKGGIYSKGYLYSGSDDISEVAWYKNNSSGGVHRIATKKPNELGIYDMSGNRGELCLNPNDIYDIEGRIYGGSWEDFSHGCKPGSWKESNKSTAKVEGEDFLRHLNLFEPDIITVRLMYPVY